MSRETERAVLGDCLTIWFVVVLVDVHRDDGSNLIAHVVERCTYCATSNTVGITRDHADQNSMA
jgi:hypothetical protein